MLGSPLSLTVAESLVATVLTGIPVILIGLVRPFVDEDGRPLPWHPLLRFTLFVLGAITIVAAMLGYHRFCPLHVARRSSSPAPCWRRCISAS